MTFLKNAFEGQNHIWRYLLGILVVFVGYFIGQLIMMGILAMKVDFDISVLQDFESTMDFSVVGLDQNTGLILLLLMFIMALAALYFVVKFLHGKEFLKLVTTRRKVDYGKILFGFGFWLLVMLVMEAGSYFISPENYQFRGISADFFILIAISLLILPVQTSFEEIFFRGYIMQGTAYFVQNKWFPVVFSSVLFGLVHSLNPEVEKYGFWTMQS
jgi:membrane protease YdiL (CAAX protease family)